MAAMVTGKMCASVTKLSLNDASLSVGVHGINTDANVESMGHMQKKERASPIIRVNVTE